MSNDDRWNDRLDHYRADLASVLHQEFLPSILVMEPDPVDFLAAVMAAIEQRCPVILGNPHWSSGNWSSAEWQAFTQLGIFNPAQSDRIYGQIPPTTVEFLDSRPLPPGAILMATGGSSGQLRFAHHTWETLSAAVVGLQRSTLVAAGAISSHCVLPLYHVSGFMQFVRSILTGGELRLESFRSLMQRLQDPVPDSEALLDGSEDCITPSQNYCLSLVPTQLHRLLAATDSRPLNWLKQFHLIFIGGAAFTADLRQHAATYPLPLVATYGMTETAGMIAALPPSAFLEAFLEGNTTVGRLLPHAQIRFFPEILEDSHKDEDPASHGQRRGRIGIRSPSLALGYYPPTDWLQRAGYWLSNDRGALGSDNYLSIEGRIDRVIITGGEKVSPERIEELLRQTGLLEDVAVLGVPDGDWGEKVVAFCVGVKDWSALKAMAMQQLSPPQRPKEWLEINTLPRNDRGKLLPHLLLKSVKPIKR